MPFYRSSLCSVENELLDYVRREGFVAPVPSDGQPDLVVFHWNYAWRDGYSYIYNVFYRNRDQVIEWSKADKQRAQFYWSEAFKYLRSEKPIDVAIGEAFLMAGWRCSNIDDLEQTLESIKKEYE